MNVEKPELEFPPFRFRLVSLGEDLEVHLAFSDGIDVRLLVGGTMALAELVTKVSPCCDSPTTRRHTCKACGGHMVSPVPVTAFLSRGDPDAAQEVAILQSWLEEASDPLSAVLLSSVFYRFLLSVHEAALETEVGVPMDPTPVTGLLLAHGGTQDDGLTL